MSLLEQSIIRKGRIDKNNVMKLDMGNNKDKEYEVEAI